MTTINNTADEFDFDNISNSNSINDDFLDYDFNSTFKVETAVPNTSRVDKINELLYGPESNRSAVYNELLYGTETTNVVAPKVEIALPIETVAPAKPKRTYTKKAKYVSTPENGCDDFDTVSKVDYEQGLPFDTIPSVYTTTEISSVDMVFSSEVTEVVVVDVPLNVVNDDVVVPTNSFAELFNSLDDETILPAIVAETIAPEAAPKNDSKGGLNDLLYLLLAYFTNLFNTSYNGLKSTEFNYTIFKGVLKIAVAYLKISFVILTKILKVFYFIMKIIFTMIVSLLTYTVYLFLK